MFAKALYAALVLGTAFNHGVTAKSPLDLLGSVKRAGVALQVGSTWDYALGYAFKASAADPDISVYFVDLFDTSGAEISAAQKAGHTIICYFSAGTFENWRPDVAKFPPSSKGNPVAGWKGERWVDTRNAQLRRNVMAPRIALAQHKGCQGVDPDNTDGYSNNSGFDLTKADDINYVRWLCQQAHGRGLACGLKNNENIIPDVINYTEWVVNEQCVQYGECKEYSPYIDAQKPVFHVEYTKNTPSNPTWKAKACNSQSNTRFSTIIKRLDLDRYTEYC